MLKAARQARARARAIYVPILIYCLRLFVVYKYVYNFVVIFYVDE